PPPPLTRALPPVPPPAPARPGRVLRGRPRPSPAAPSPVASGRRARAPDRPSAPGLVLPGPGIDADRVTRLDEDRDLHHEARLGRGRLARAGLGVAREAKVRLDHRQGGARLQLHV